MRRAAKRDENEKEIVEALRAEGYQVIVLGLPVDLLVFRPGGHFMFLEVKTDTGRPTEVQKKFFDNSLGCRRGYVRSVEEALAFVESNG